MRRWYRYFLFFFVVVEFGALSYFGMVIYNNQRQSKLRVLGETTTVVPVKKENLIFPPDSAFDQFYEIQASISFDEQGYWQREPVTYTINTDGLNESRDYAIEKPDDVFRIVTLGDSFTFGEYIRTDSNWTELLEDRFSTGNCLNGKRVEIINLGVMGYDLIFASYRYKFRGMKYKPDMVLWFVNNHNFHNIPQLFNERVEQLRNRLSGEEYEASKQPEKTAELWNQAKAQIKQIYEKSRISAQEKEALYEFGKVYSGPLVFVINNVLEENFRHIREFAETRTHPTYIDMPLLHIDTHPEYEFPDRHPNEAGHRYIAESVYSYLLSKSLIPCSGE